MMIRLGIIQVLIVLIVPLFLFSPSWATHPKFPDRLSFSQVPGVQLEMLAYENMDEVSLKPEEIKAHVAKQLRNAGIHVDEGSQIHQDIHSPRKNQSSKSDGMAILGVRVNRTEDSAMFVAKIGNVAITLHLFQRVKVERNQHSTQAITWSESRSILGGSKRPKKIFEALDALVKMFVRDFQVAPSNPQ
ncbi:MAG: hypothetical protein NPIRA01_38470 [Nitrospirales bacterium]|nr:MAG: hypothetical protein NPIRA01_38470 [Nitrospirales bacterium]